MIPYALTLSLLIPFVLAIILYLLRQRLERSIVPLTLVLLIIPTILFLLVTPQATSRNGAVENFNWASLPSLTGATKPPLVALQVGLLLDGINLPVVLITAVMSILTVLYSVKYQREMPGKTAYYINILLLFVGMEGVLLATNLIEFYIFWEFMLIPSYFLVAMWGTKGRSYATGMKYFLYTFVGSLPLLIGIAATYAFTQNFSIVAAPGSAQANLIAVTAALILIGLAVKMAIVPLHTWLPDTYVDAPTPVTALISSVMGKTGAYALIRLVLLIFAPTLQSLGWAFFLPFAAFGVLTMIYGGFMALASTELKRLLAYSSISQLGYIFYGIGSFSVVGVTGSVFHMVNHALGIGALFFCAGNIALQAGTTELDKLRGVAWKMPITSFGLLVGALTLAGIPPLSGFFSEWNIFLGGFSQFNLGIGAILAFLAVSTVFLTFSYYLWLIYRFFIAAPAEGVATVKEAPLSLNLPIIFLSLITIVLGFASSPVLQVIAQPAGQIQGILGGP